MICCKPSRRAVLGWSAVVLGAAVLPERAVAATGTAVAAVNLELVTLTESGAVLTWYTGVPGTSDDVGQPTPALTDAVVRYGTGPGRLDQVAYGPAGTAYHYVELTGLEPGRTYYYQAFSNGVAATATVLAGGNAVGTSGAATGTGPFTFSTPQPPPGDHLFTVALCNDLHLGETVAGLVGGISAIKGISQVPGHLPYPQIMASAMVADALDRGARFLLAAGDLSSEAAPVDDAAAKGLLDGFGAYRADYLVARGNHDRAHTGTAYASCGIGQWQGNDCFRDEFFGDGPTYFSQDLGGLHVVGLDTYDKPGNGGDSGGLSADQLAWFKADLKAHKEQPTVVFGHHPLFTEADPLALTGAHSLAPGQALQIMAAYDGAPGVFLHHAGHTHRNRRAVFAGAPRVVQQEVSATKEYPGGFTLLRLHTGGYALNYYKTRSEQARAWSERSRRELSGLWPQLSLGARVADRNSVAARDLTGLSPM